ncbi:hypothetical protein HDK77DRAFT_425947 [Phyllosticta capitalensis]
MMIQVYERVKHTGGIYTIVIKLPLRYSIGISKYIISLSIRLSSKLLDRGLLLPLLLFILNIVLLVLSIERGGTIVMSRKFFLSFKIIRIVNSRYLEGGSSKEQIIRELETKHVGGINNSKVINISTPSSKRERTTL